MGLMKVRRVTLTPENGVVEDFKYTPNSGLSKLIITVRPEDTFSNQAVAISGVLSATAKTFSGKNDFILTVENGVGGEGHPNPPGSVVPAPLNYDINSGEPQLIPLGTIGEIIFTIAGDLTGVNKVVYYIEEYV